MIWCVDRRSRRRPSSPLQAPNSSEAGRLASGKPTSDCQPFTGSLLRSPEKLFSSKCPDNSRSPLRIAPGAEQVSCESAAACMPLSKIIHPGCLDKL